LIKKIKYPLLLPAICILCLLVMHHYQIITTVFRDSVFYASIIMMINFTFFLIFWEYSKNKNNKTFLIFNLGGMAFRLILTLIGVFVVIKFLNIDKYAFIFTLFIWYILFLTYEIVVFKKKAGKVTLS